MRTPTGEVATGETQRDHVIERVRFRDQRWFRLGAAILATLGTGYVLLHKVSLNQILHRWNGIPAMTYVVLLGLMVVFVWLRGVRFHSVLQSWANGGRLFMPAAAYTLASQILPGGAGELSLPLLLRPLGFSAGQSFAVLVVTRFLDLAVSLVLGGMVWFLVAASTARPPLVVLAVPTLIVCVGGAVLFAPVQHWLMARLEARGAKNPSKTLMALRDALTTLSNLRGFRLVQLLILTVAIKMLAVTFYVILAGALQTGLTFLQVSLATQLSTLLFAVPVQGIAGIGTVDAWWALALRVAGASTTSAISYAVIFHFTYLLTTVVIGLGPLVKRFWSLPRGVT